MAWTEQLQRTSDIVFDHYGHDGLYRATPDAEAVPCRVIVKRNVAITGPDGLVIERRTTVRLKLSQVAAPKRKAYVTVDNETWELESLLERKEFSEHWATR